MTSLIEYLEKEIQKMVNERDSLHSQIREIKVTYPYPLQRSVTDCLSSRYALIEPTRAIKILNDTLKRHELLEKAASLDSKIIVKLVELSTEKDRLLKSKKIL